MGLTADGRRGGGMRLWCCVQSVKGMEGTGASGIGEAKEDFVASTPPPQQQNQILDQIRSLYCHRKQYEQQYSQAWPAVTPHSIRAKLATAKSNLIT